jgi:hypothetical protein
MRNFNAIALPTRAAGTASANLIPRKRGYPARGAIREFLTRILTAIQIRKTAHGDLLSALDFASSGRPHALNMAAYHANWATLTLEANDPSPSVILSDTFQYGIVKLTKIRLEISCKVGDFGYKLA